MSTPIRLLPLLCLAALLALPVAASAASSNGRSDGRRSASSESRRAGDRDRDGARADRRDARSPQSRVEERRRSDSSAGRSSSQTRTDGHASHGSHQRAVVRTTSHHGSTHGAHHTTHAPVVSYGHGHHRVVVVTQRPRVVVHHAPDPYFEPMYLNERALDDVLYSLDRARFSSDKLAIISDVARRYTYSTWAVEQMVRRLTFSGDRVDALAMLYPRVHDTQSWFRVYELLTFSSDRDALRRRCH